MNVCVVPEDHRDDQYIIKPLFEKLLKDSDAVPGGKPTVRLYQQTTGMADIRQELPDVKLKYGHYDAILVTVDRDCEESRQQSVADWIERVGFDDVAALTIPCIAIEEVEIWLLGLHDEKLDDYWGDVRSECSLKERYFEPFLEEYGDPKAPGGGRARLMNRGLEEKSLSSLFQKCSELEECLESLETIFAS